MNPDSIYFKLAEQAGFHADKDSNPRIGYFWWSDETDLDSYLLRFAQLVAAHEREACAAIVDPSEEHRRDASWGYIGGNEGVELLDARAAAIRARGDQ
jgi:hypothetical protein